MMTSLEPRQTSDQANGSGRFLYAKPLWKRMFGYVVGPMLVCAVAIGIHTTTRVITAEEERPAELVARMRDGDPTERWEAAFSLTRFLGGEAAERVAASRVLAPELTRLFEEHRAGDAAMRRYLALALGHLGEARAVAPLRRALASGDVELVINALVALAMLGDTAAVPDIVAASRHERSEVRAAAVYALGVLGSEPAFGRLSEALADAAPPVRWNAAFGLARHGDAGGETIIAEILDRGRLYTSPDANAAERRELFLNAVRAAGMVRTPVLTAKLQRIARGDGDVEARKLALSTLEEQP